MTKFPTARYTSKHTAESWDNFINKIRWRTWKSIYKRSTEFRLEMKITFSTKLRHTTASCLAEIYVSNNRVYIVIKVKIVVLVIDLLFNTFSHFGATANLKTPHWCSPVDEHFENWTLGELHSPFLTRWNVNCWLSFVLILLLLWLFHISISTFWSSQIDLFSHRATLLFVNNRSRHEETTHACSIQLTYRSSCTAEI